MEDQQRNSSRERISLQANVQQSQVSIFVLQWEDGSFKYSHRLTSNGTYHFRGLIKRSRYWYSSSSNRRWSQPEVTLCPRLRTWTQTFWTKFEEHSSSSKLKCTIRRPPLLRLTSLSTCSRHSNKEGQPPQVLSRLTISKLPLLSNSIINSLTAASCQTQVPAVMT